MLVCSHYDTFIVDQQIVLNHFTALFLHVDLAAAENKSLWNSISKSLITLRGLLEQTNKIMEFSRWHKMRRYNMYYRNVNRKCPEYKINSI